MTNQKCDDDVQALAVFIEARLPWYELPKAEDTFETRESSAEDFLFAWEDNYEFKQLVNRLSGSSDGDRCVRLSAVREALHCIGIKYAGDAEGEFALAEVND